MEKKPYVKPKLYVSAKLSIEAHHKLKVMSAVTGVKIIDLLDKIVAREYARHEKHSALAISNQESTGGAK